MLRTFQFATFISLIVFLTTVCVATLSQNPNGRLIVGVCTVGTFIISFVIIALSQQRSYVPKRDRKPRLRTRQKAKALHIQRGTLIVTGADDKRHLSTQVSIHDKSIRPFIQFYVTKKEYLGKESTLQCTFIEPFSSRIIWRVNIPCTLQEGLNQAWPGHDTFLIAGQRVKQGQWMVKVELLHTNETTYYNFSVDAQVIPLILGPDATVSNTDASKVIQDNQGTSVEDLLENL